MGAEVAFEIGCSALRSTQLSLSAHIERSGGSVEVARNILQNETCKSFIAIPPPAAASYFLLSLLLFFWLLRRQPVNGSAPILAPPEATFLKSICLNAARGEVIEALFLHQPVRRVRSYTVSFSGTPSGSESQVETVKQASERDEFVLGKCGNSKCISPFLSFTVDGRTERYLLAHPSGAGRLSGLPPTFLCYYCLAVHTVSES